MVPAVMVMPVAVMMVPRDNHVRHDVMAVMPVVAAVMVPAMMVILCENQRVRIFSGDAAIDRTGARGARQGLRPTCDEGSRDSDDGCKHQATHFLFSPLGANESPWRRARHQGPTNLTGRSETSSKFRKS
ncbi:hypothetical protein X566_21995 [Afipia sp. P52-10]|jgi:hypothetical protein|nr:hypothetical protein X566_21995 [Afipia sp. P52-10]